VQDIALGDVITHIDGQPVGERLAEWEVWTSPYTAFSTYLILSEWLVGVNGSSVNLTIESMNDGDVYTTEVEYGDAPFYSDYIYIREARPEVISQLGDGIVYVDLTRMTNLEYRVAYDTIANAEGLVFDMRGYPSPTFNGLSILSNLADTNLSSPPFLIATVVTSDHQDMYFADITISDYVIASGQRFSDNVAFLVNGNGAVSYAETIMGLVEGHQLGEIIGSPTAGANGNRIEIQLPAGFRLSYTGMRVTKFDGTPLFTVGVTPTIPVDRSRIGVAEERDELLEVAFATLGGNALSIEPLVLDTSFLTAFIDQVGEQLGDDWLMQDDIGAFIKPETTLYLYVDFDFLVGSVIWRVNTGGKGSR